MRELIKYSKRIVIKLGTGLLTKDAGIIDNEIINSLVRQICRLIHEGREIVIVSSGAIGAGFPYLNLTKRPTTLPLLQASASIGQAKLMRIYDDLFSKENIYIAQILLTRDDLKVRKRHLNVRNTLNSLLQNKVIPIINENDTVSVDEIKFGDNDLLSALVTNLIQGDLLINLTSVDGLMRKSSDGKSLDNIVIHEVKGVSETVKSESLSVKTALGTGGMKSKLQAAKIVNTAGEFMVIANGRKENILLRILNGEEIGTLFIPDNDKMDCRKRWIAFFDQPKGKIIIDSGAREAILEKGKSLLPSGIKDIEGKFGTGDVVLICGEDSKEIARGLVNFSSNEVTLISGFHTKEIERILGSRPYDEVVHRNNLVVTFDKD